MDYEKLYKESLERAKIWQEHLYEISDKDYADELNYIFPELKEPEDEKIRKDIISFLKEGKPYICPNSVKRQEWAAWLEKQGESKPTDKVEPKFKQGEWIVWKDKNYKVNYNGCGYGLFDQNGLSTSLEYGTVEESAHLWAIRDAKDGDVLCDGTTIFIFKDLLSDGSVMSYCDYDTGSSESDAFCPLSMNLVCSKITPATKEQRALLFSKMKGAEYEWDAEKKELKKIVQKTAWSEDDIVAIDCAVKILSKDLPSLAASIERLKSLKDRCT